MAVWRKPSPLGWGGQCEVLAEGPLSRQLSARPGPLCVSRSLPATLNGREAPQFKARRPSLPHLRHGDRGDNVKKLQLFLNFRLDLQPPLDINGDFWPPTRNAVMEFQASRSIKPDGEVDNTTWYHLIAGTPAKQISAVARAFAGTNSRAGTRAGRSNGSAWLPPRDSVMDWPLQNKFEYAVDKVLSKLSVQFRTLSAGLVPRQPLAMTLHALAESELFQVDTVSRQSKMVMLGEQVFRALAYPIQIMALAATQSELDEAVVYLAEAMAAAGIPALTAALARCELVAVGRATQPAPSAPTKPPLARPAPCKAPLPPLAFDAPKTWIEIKLVDQDSNPVPGEKYRVKLPDDSTVEGTLDEKGRALIDGIDPGNCVVSFPNIDSREWNAA